MSEPRYRTALDYTPLIGRMIRMERPATRDERAAGEPDTHGMECLVAEISDIDVGVLIVSDEGLAMLVRPDEQDAWRFTVWPSTNVRLCRADPAAVSRLPTPPPGTLARIYCQTGDRSATQVALLRRLSEDGPRVAWCPIDGNPPVPNGAIERIEPLYLVSSAGLGEHPDQMLRFAAFTCQTAQHSTTAEFLLDLANQFK